MSITAHPTEAEWLAKTALGDQRAFEALYQLYSPRIYKRTLQLLKNEALVEEVLQDVFVKIWEKRRELDHGKSFQSLLYRIATNMVMDLYRKAAVDQRMMENFIRESTEIYDPQMESSEDKARVKLNILLNTLPAQRRRVFELVKIEQKSYEEVAELLGISKSTVSDHVVKATKALKAYSNLNDALNISLVAMIIASI